MSCRYGHSTGLTKLSVGANAPGNLKVDGAISLAKADDLGPEIFGPIDGSGIPCSKASNTEVVDAKAAMLPTTVINVRRETVDSVLFSIVFFCFTILLRGLLFIVLLLGLHGAYALYASKIAVRLAKIHPMI
jgi:hypothetical protein